MAGNFVGRCVLEGGRLVRCVSGPRKVVRGLRIGTSQWGIFLALAFTKQFLRRHRELAMPRLVMGEVFPAFGFLGCHRTDERRMMFLQEKVYVSCSEYPFAGCGTNGSWGIYFVALFIHFLRRFRWVVPHVGLSSFGVLFLIAFVPGAGSVDDVYADVSAWDPSLYDSMVNYKGEWHAERDFLRDDIYYDFDADCYLSGSVQGWWGNIYHPDMFLWCPAWVLIVGFVLLLFGFPFFGLEGIGNG